MSTAEPYRDAKAKENTKQATEAINIFKLQSKMAGFRKDYVTQTCIFFLQTVFLAQNLGSFSIKVYNLDSRKKPKILRATVP